MRAVLPLLMMSLPLAVCAEWHYTLDGGMASFGGKVFVYDSGARLSEVWSNDVKIVENQYDPLGRRVRKIMPEETHAFVYDDWLVVLEDVEHCGGASDRIEYVWGKDIVGSLYDAGGIGGLLYLKRNGAVYIPLFDANGNVIAYVDAQGNIVAEYLYDVFGNMLEQRGSMADVFHMKFSTKYYDRETGLYYFGRRFYCPQIGRWMSRDPAGEDGGLNLYQFCGNAPTYGIDPLGMKIVVLKNLIGRIPPGGWGDCGRNLAQTHYKEPVLTFKEVKKPGGKIGFEVTITPAISPVIIYFRGGCPYPVSMAHEMQHVKWIERYDAAIEKFKEDVEGIVDCPAKAWEKFRCMKRLLDKRKAYIVSENNKLDAPGGPHDH